MMTNILCGNFEKSFPECEKNAFKKDLPALPPREFFHTVFPVQFGIDLHLRVFQKLTRPN